MGKFDRYIIKNILKIFVLSESIGFGIFFLVEFFEKIEEFTRSPEKFTYGSLCILYKSPHFLNFIIPLSLLVSILVTFLVMIRRNEIIALRTSGISTLSIIKPIILLSISLAFFSLLLSEFFVPPSLKKSKYIYRIKVKNEEPYVFIKNDRIWIKTGQRISNIEYFDPKKDIIKGLTIFELKGDFSIKKRIDAEEGRWDGNLWHFYNVQERKFEENQIEKRFYPEKTGLIQDPPSIFKIVKRTPEEMSFRELKRYIEKLKKGGYNTKRYLVDLYAKISFPFINFVMVFLGAACGLRYRRTTPVSLGIFFGLLIGFIYWILYSLSLSLGYAEIFFPFFSSLFPHLFFLSFGLIGILTLRR